MSPNNEFAIIVDEWFDGNTRRNDGPTTFRIDGGHIADIAVGDHSATLVGNGLPIVRGKFLMPGLVDAHVHLFLDGAPTDGKVRSEHLKQSVDALTEAARRSARQSVQCGVTLVRDAGDRHGINHQIRFEARDPGAGMCHIRSGGSALKRPKRYGAFMGTDVDSDSEIRTAVADKSANCDEIKLILTGIIDFDAGAVTDNPQFDLEMASEVVQAAQACNRKVFAHCSGLKGLEIAARAGVGSIEHGFFMTRDILAVMSENSVAWTPTFCPVQFQWREPGAVGWSSQTVENLRRILDSHAEHLLMAHAMGVTLLLGTDAGSMGVEHGRAVFDEIECYLAAGLPLEAVLRSATSTPRRYFGDDNFLLEKGARFDAVLLSESPFVDIFALRNPGQVWLAGNAAK